MSYEPTVWKDGDLVTSAKLNKMEQGIREGGIVNATEENGILTLDKTWQEIWDNKYTTICCRPDNMGGLKSFFFIQGLEEYENEYYVYTNLHEFHTENVNNYPMVKTGLSPEEILVTLSVPDAESLPFITFNGTQLSLNSLQENITINLLGFNNENPYPQGTIRLYGTLYGQDSSTKSSSSIKYYLVLNFTDNSQNRIASMSYIPVLATPTVPGPDPVTIDLNSEYMVIVLNEGVLEIQLRAYDDQGNIIFFYHIILTDLTYINNSGTR